MTDQDPDTGAPTPGAWLARYRQAGQPAMALATAAGTLAGLATVAQLGLLAWLVQRALVAEQAPGQAGLALALIVAVILVRAGALTLQGWFAARASDAIRSRLRRQLLANWSARGPAADGLHRGSSGAAASAWLDQVEALHSYYAHFLPQLWLCLLVPLPVLLVVAWLDWLAALFLLLSAPLIPLFMALVGMGAEQLNRQHMQTLARLSGLFLDSIRGITTLQLFGRTGAAADKVAAATDEYRRINLKTLRVAFLSSAVLEFFASVAIAVVAIYIGFGLLGYIHFGPAPELTLFSGLFILLLAPEFFQPLRQLALHYHDRAAALGAASLLQLALRPPAGADTKAEGPRKQPAGGDDQHIELKGVVLDHGRRRPALDDISLTISAGSVVVLTGASGSGKTSVLNCLAGFVRPTRGHVSVFGEAPGARPFGWISQQPFLLQGTWADNLRLVAPTANALAMTTALQSAGLGELLQSRPQGLDTPLSEDGGGLSGGQARRLALARVFLARYALVLMDEPTAGLDPVSERHVLAALERLRQQGTTLVIASHHEAVTAMADYCVVLDQGRIREPDHV